MSYRKERQSNFELLRIVAMLLIISFHYVWHGQMTLNLGTVNRITADFFLMFGELGVNVFVLLSGYFLFESSFKWRRLVQILFQAEFYYLLTRMITIGAGAAQLSDFRGISAWTFPVLTGNWWFVTAYVCLYIFSPYLNKMLHSFTQHEFHRFLLTAFIIYSAIPTVITWIYAGQEGTEAFLYYNRFIWMIFVYAIGAYIRRYDSVIRINSLKRAVTAFLGTGGFIICFVACINLLKLKGYHIFVDATYFYQPNSVPELIWSIALFQIFHYLHVRSSKLINFLAKGTLGIYMFHDSILRNWIWNDLFHAQMNAQAPFLAVRIVLAAVIVFAAGSVVDFFFRLLWQGIDHVINGIYMKGKA